MVNTKVSELNPIINSNLNTSDLFMMARADTESFKLSVGELDKRFISVNFANYTQVVNGDIVTSDQILLQTSSGLARLAFSELDTRFAPPDINSYPPILSVNLNASDSLVVRQSSGNKRISVQELDQRYLGAIPNISTNAKNNLVATNSDGTFLIRKNYKFPIIVDFLEIDPSAFFTPSGNVLVSNLTGASAITGKQSAQFTFSGTSEASVTTDALSLDKISLRDKEVATNIDLDYDDTQGKAFRFELETSVDGIAWNPKLVLNDNSNITTSGLLKIRWLADFANDKFFRVKLFLNHASSTGSTVVKADNIALDIYPESGNGEGGSGGSASTARISGGQLSQVDATHFAISDGTGIHYDYFTDPLNPVVTEVSWSNITNALDQNLASPVNWVGIDKNGTVVQSMNEFLREETRDVIRIGANFHINNEIVDTVNISPVVHSPINQIEDILDAIGTITNGNHYEPSGANLKIKKTSGSSLILGGGATIKDPNSVDRGEIVAAPFVLFRRDGAGGYIRTDGVTDITPSVYDNNQTNPVSVPTNNYQNIRIYYSASFNITGVLMGQNTYSTIADAQSAILGEEVDVPAELQGIPLRTILIVKKEVTDLTAAVANDTARFIKIGKFGQGIIGGATSSVTTIQGAYNNSVGQPKIRLTDVIGAFLIQDSIAGFPVADTRFGIQNKDGDAFFLRVTGQKVYAQQFGLEQSETMNIGPTTGGNISITDDHEVVLVRNNFRYPYIQDFKESTPSDYITPSSGSGLVGTETGTTLGGYRSALLTSTADVEYIGNTIDILNFSAVKREVSFAFDYLSDGTFLYSARLESSPDNSTWSTVQTKSLTQDGTYKFDVVADKTVTRYYRIVWIASGVTVSTSAIVGNIRLDIYPSKDPSVQNVYDISTDFKIDLDQTKEGLRLVAPTGNPDIDYIKVLENDELTEIFKVDNDGLTTRGVTVSDANGSAIIGKNSENALEVSDKQETFVLRPEHDILKNIDFRELDVPTDITTTANINVTEVTNIFGKLCPQISQATANSATDFAAIPVQLSTSEATRLALMKNPRMAIVTYKSGGSGSFSCEINSTTGTAFTKPEFILKTGQYEVSDFSFDGTNQNNLNFDVKFIPYIEDNATTLQVFGIVIYDAKHKTLDIDRIFEWDYTQTDKIVEQVKGSIVTSDSNQYVQFTPSVDNEVLSFEFDVTAYDFSGKADAFNNYQLSLKYDSRVTGYSLEIYDDSDSLLLSKDIPVTIGTAPINPDILRVDIPINKLINDVVGKFKVKIVSTNGSTVTDPMYIFGMNLDTKIYPLGEIVEVNRVNLKSNGNEPITGLTENVVFNGTGTGWSPTNYEYTIQKTGASVCVNGGININANLVFGIYLAIDDGTGYVNVLQIHTNTDATSFKTFNVDVPEEYCVAGYKVAIRVSINVTLQNVASPVAHFLNISESINKRTITVEADRVPDIVTAKVTPTDIITNENYEGFITGVSRSGSTITITFQEQNEPPAFQATLAQSASGGLIQPENVSVTTTSIVFDQRNSTNAPVSFDYSWNVAICRSAKDIGNLKQSIAITLDEIRADGNEYPVFGKYVYVNNVKYQLYKISFEGSVGVKATGLPLTLKPVDNAWFKHAANNTYSNLIGTATNYVRCDYHYAGGSQGQLAVTQVGAYTGDDEIYTFPYYDTARPLN